MQESKYLDIDKYLDIFSKYKWFGLIPSGALMVMLSIAALVQPKVYESKCIVEVDRGAIENPLKNRADRPSALVDSMRIFSESALRWDVLSRVVDKVGSEKIIENGDLYNLPGVWRRLSLNWGRKQVPEENSQRKESVTNLLRKAIKLQQKEPQFIVIAYRGTNSATNAQILNTLVSTIIEDKIRQELNYAGRSFEFLKAEMENYRAKLEEAEARLKDFKEQHISELPNNMNINQTQLASDKSEVLASELELKELKARVQYIDERIEKENKLIVSEVKREANPMLVVLNERIVDMEIDLTRLRTNYTDLHPKIVELKGQIEDLKRQKEKVEKATLDTETSMLNPVYQQLMADKQNALMRIEVLKNRIANLYGRVNENERKVRSMPAQEQQLVTLTRNYEVMSNIYNMFLQKVEEVRLQEKLAMEEKDKESFRVIEYARATFTPVAPNKFRSMLVIALVGVGTCLGIIAALNSFDDSLKSVEEAKELLRKPMLGTIPSLSGQSDNGSTSIHKKLARLITRS